jgi:hypothetical protein
MISHNNAWFVGESFFFFWTCPHKKGEVESLISTLNVWSGSIESR